MPPPPEVGSSLRIEREARGLTQEKLGELSGVHATTISLIELGKSEGTLGTLVDLALALRLEPDYLIRLKMPGGLKLSIASLPPETEPRTLSVHEPGRGPGLVAKRQFVVVIQRSRQGYSAAIPDLPGCTATGATKQAAEASILRAGNDHIQGLHRAGRPIPSPEAYTVAMTFNA